MATDSAVAVDNSARVIAGLAGLHAAAVAAPLLAVGLLLLPPALAVVIALVVAVAITGLRLRGMDARVTASLGARPADAEVEARFVNLAEHLTMAVGVPVPRVHIIDSPAVNAVVWGTGNGPASIAATSGLLDAADRVELEAVVARLLVSARDHLIEGPTVAAALFGNVLVAPIRSLALRSLDLERLVAVDLEGARVTRYPPGSAAALQRVQQASTVSVDSPRALRPLWLVDPVDGADESISVHPPLGDRIDLIREM